MDIPKPESWASFQNLSGRNSVIPIPVIGPAVPGVSRPLREPYIPMIIAPPTPIPALTFRQHDTIQHRKLATPTHDPLPQPQRPAIPRIPWWENERPLIAACIAIGASLVFYSIALLLDNVIDLRDIPPLVRVLLATLIACIFLSASLLLRTRNLHPAAYSSCLVVSASIFAIVSLVSTYYYSWLPEWLGAILLLVLIIGFFLLARAWDTYITFAILILVFFTATLSFQYNSTSFEFFPGALVGLLALAFTLTKEIPSETVRQFFGFIAYTALSLGAVVGDAQYDSHSVSPTLQACIWAATLVALLVCVHVNKNLRGELLLHSGFLAIGVLILNWWTQYTFTFELWMVFGCIIIWLACSYIFQSQNTRISQLIALLVLPISVVVISINSNENTLPPRAMIPWIFLIVFAAVVLWITEQYQHWSVWAVWSLVSLYMVSPMHSSVFLKRPIWLTSHHSETTAILLAVLLAVCLWRWRSIVKLPPIAVFLLCILGLHYSILAFVATTTYIGAKIQVEAGMWLGYYLGHALISISFITVSGWLLLGKTRIPARASLAIGLTFAITAIAKLVLFDMGTLPGLPRILACIISGVFLLFIATKRSQMTNSRLPLVPSTPPQVQVSPQFDHNDTEAR
ncbi:hypothetical protein [Corynebacterium freiburgense]|uniref:hypothetical protein n=1 Tax=Corynebacterium freiburgense TaxID=556548 RepID=UPI00040BFCF2|nr:hypothetical protein [Corynebacterium freiburgense]WJZ02516.1 hypothetical protein CFREI_06130 [Corynebacterium freiburgense]